DVAVDRRARRAAHRLWALRPGDEQRRTRCSVRGLAPGGRAVPALGGAYSFGIRSGQFDMIPSTPSAANAAISSAPSTVQAFTRRPAACAAVTSSGVT